MSGVAAPHPLLRDRIPFCGVDHYQPRWRPDSKGLDNRNYARRFAANLNVGEPRTVRMIYFLPNDRPYQAEVVQKMKDEIRTVQTFFADQMEAHGYGRRTFRVETDSQGEPIVHRVDGQHPDSYYFDNPDVYSDVPVSNETQLTFNPAENVHLIVADNRRHGLSDTAGGIGHRVSKTGGEAITSETFDWILFAHELGHAFGLQHNFREGAYVMSYGNGGRNQLSACHAEYLSVHPYFNPDTPVYEVDTPTIKLISPRTYSPGSTSVSVRIQVNDSDGLHQVILHAAQPNNRWSVKECRGFSGKRSATITFDYDGVIPSAHDPSYSRNTSLLNPLIHPIVIEAVDMNGDVDSSMKDGHFRFVLFSEALEPLTKISGDNQASLPNTTLPAPFVIEVRDLDDGSPLFEVPISFTVTAGGGSLSVLHTETDWSGRAESVLTLGPNLGTNTVTVSAAGIEGTVTFTAVATAPVEIPDRKLRAAIEDALKVPPGTPIAPAAMATLDTFEPTGANISDLTGLEFATNLSVLYLGDNNISDLSPLADLTHLKTLGLNDNAITDISVLAELTNLAELYLAGNPITDISVLRLLTNLTSLQPPGGISDISVVTGLTNLTYLNIGGGSISDISGVSALTNLTELLVYYSHISDISAVSGLTNLRRLGLGYNRISDLSPLVANAGLRDGDWVDVSGNPLSYQSIHTHIPNLQNRGVEVEFTARSVARLLKISGDNQQGTVGEMLTNPFVVEVKDQDNAAFAGVPVTFTVTDGSGTLSVTSTTTDENGKAASALTLGLDPGTNTVVVSAGGRQVIFNASASPLTSEYLWSIPASISLIHVPLRVTEVNGREQTIERIGDLYDALGGASKVNFLVTYDPQTQEWPTYSVLSAKGDPEDVSLTENTGIIAGLRTRTEVRLRGNPWGRNGNSTITLSRGVNLVGLPLHNSTITHVSDLLALNGIDGNVFAIVVTDGEFKAVTQADAPGDIEITGGQAFIMNAQRTAMVTISGDAWTNEAGTAAAPPVTLKGIEVGETTPVLGLRGSIVDEGTDLNNAGFRVTVKNLSTGRAVATVTTPDEAGYRSTIVDIEAGRAATIGDTLEISAQSLNPFIGVHLLRYTVTAEDVRRSLIQLPELVAYEIPKETQLLTNYPNPFNPETWIPYRLAEDAIVTLTIYDQNGRVVRTLEIGHRIAAVYESRSQAIHWDGRNEFGETVASGLYFYQLQADDYSATRKALILK